LSKSKFIEIKEEIQEIFTGRRNLIDSILPPLLFVLINEIISFEAAMWSSLALALLISIVRIVRGQPVLSALGGIATAISAIFLAKWFGRNESYFLPNMLSNAFLVVLFVISLILGKPMFAWGSHFLRSWPLEWYWHPRVRPAYMEVSLMWLLLIALRSIIQWFLYHNGAVDELALLTLFTGAPAILALVVLSYIYGSWRLRQLGGPSVEEYRVGSTPPWHGQERGF